MVRKTRSPASPTKAQLKVEVTALRKKVARLGRERARHQRAEEGLRQRATQCRQALAERKRTTHTFLDDVMQSLFAVGVQLEACTQLLETNPRRAGHEDTQSVRQLNDVIRRVRSFMAGLQLRT